MTKEEINAKADSYNWYEESVIEFAIEVSNQQLDTARDIILVSNLNPQYKMYVLEMLESLKIV